MKKILLGTTGLIGAALLATAASAETPKVTLGGSTDFQAAWTDNDAAAVVDHPVGFRNDTEISVKVDGKQGSLGYGAQVDLEADQTNDNNNEGTNASRTFVYLEGGWGRTEMGGNKSAASTMRVDASTLAVATGGINGDWVHFVNPTGANTNPGATTVDNNFFITNSELQVEHGSVDLLDDETTYNNNKITYYTPRFSGFQAGVSYSPDANAKGQLAQRVETTFNNAWEAGLGYEGQFSGVRLAASATGNWASDESGAGEDIEGWTVGALAGWNAFSLAGSWGSWDKGAAIGGAGVVTPAGANTDGNYWTAGLGYEAGAFGVSATYLSSELSVAGSADNEFSNLVVGADYKLAPGITPYVEASFYEFDSITDTTDNDGTGIIAGTKVNF